MSTRSQRIIGTLLVGLLCSTYAERPRIEIADAEVAKPAQVVDPLPATNPNAQALVVYKPTKSLLGRVKKHELELTVPASSLVKIGSGSIKTSMKKILDSVAWQVTQTIGTAIGAPGDWAAVAVGVVLFAGQSVSAGVLDFISWAGVAGAGLSAVDAVGKIATAEHGCEYAIGGLQLLFATASLGLGIASLTCLAGTDGGTIAAFAAGAGDIFWSAIEEPLNQWCEGKKDAASVPVVVPQGGSGGFQNEDQVAAFAAASVKAPEVNSKCRKGNFPKPEKADQMFPPRISWSKLIADDYEKPATCLGDLCSDLAYGSGWSFTELNATKEA